MFTYNLTVILSHNTKQCVEQELENQVKTGSASCSVLPVQKQRNRLLYQLKRFQFKAKRKVFKWLLNMHHASPLGQLYDVTHKVLLWDKTVRERNSPHGLFLEYACLWVGRVVHFGLRKQVRWAMQKGRMKENAVAQLRTTGKHHPQTGIKSGEVCWTEVHRLTEVSEQWAKHISVPGMSSCQALARL